MSDRLLHICEVCGIESVLTSADASALGWNYPPFAGEFGVLGPRTCPDCLVGDTLWFRFKADYNTINAGDMEFMFRVKNEPDSIAVK